MTLNSQPEAWAFRAIDALAEEINGNHEEAARITRSIVEEHGAPIITRVMLVWIDMVQMYIGAEVGEVIRPQFREASTGEIDDVDGVSWDTAWAGRAMAARIADDRDTFNALIRSLPDAEHLDRAVARTLECCALTIRDGREVAWAGRRP